MELRQIRYFKAVADASSFVRGADYLNIAQPALSRSIAKLEDEIGHALFVRHSTGVSLTDAGLNFYKRAEEILEKVRGLAEEMAAQDGDFRGSVVLGAPQSIQAKLLLPVMAAFIARYPKARVDLIQGSSAYLRDRILEGGIDIAVISDLMTTSGVNMTPLVRESVCLVCPIEEAGRFGPSIERRELAGLPLIMTGHPQGIQSFVDRTLPQLDQPFVQRSEVNSSAVVVELVRRGAGFGVAPYCLMEPPASDRVAFIPINGMSVSWVIATHWNRQGSRAVQEIENLLAAHVLELIGSGNWPTASVVRTPQP